MKNTTNGQGNNMERILKEQREQLEKDTIDIAMFGAPDATKIIITGTLATTDNGEVAIDGAQITFGDKSSEMSSSTLDGTPFTLEKEVNNKILEKWIENHVDEEAGEVTEDIDVAYIEAAYSKVIEQPEDIDVAYIEAAYSKVIEQSEAYDDVNKMENIVDKKPGVEIDVTEEGRISITGKLSETSDLSGKMANFGDHTPGEILKPTDSQPVDTNSTMGGKPYDNKTLASNMLNFGEQTPDNPQTTKLDLQKYRNTLNAKFAKYKATANSGEEARIKYQDNMEQMARDIISDDIDRALIDGILMDVSVLDDLSAKTQVSELSIPMTKSATVRTLIHRNVVSLRDPVRNAIHKSIMANDLRENPDALVHTFSTMDSVHLLSFLKQTVRSLVFDPRTNKPHETLEYIEDTQNEFDVNNRYRDEILAKYNMMNRYLNDEADDLFTYLKSTIENYGEFALSSVTFDIEHNGKVIRNVVDTTDSTDDYNLVVRIYAV